MTAKSIYHLGILLTLLTITSELSAATRRLSPLLQRAIATRCYHEQAVATLNWLEQERANRLDDLSNTWHQIITLAPSKADAEAARKCYLAEMAAITREYDLCIGSQREAFEPR